MSSGYERMAAALRGPKLTASDTIISAAANTGGFDLYTELSIPTNSEAYVTIQSTVACNVRFGAAVSTATAGDWPVNANTPEPFLLDASTRYLSVYGSAGGTLYAYKSS